MAVDAAKLPAARRVALWPAAGWALLLAVYSYTLWLMLRIVLQYVSLSPDAAFLATKQDYVGLGYYRAAFFIHVFSAGFVLLAAYTQFWPRLRQRYRAWHRGLGRLYAYVVLGLAGPSGLVLGLYANGGWTSRVAFCLLAALWIAFTALALRAMQARRIEAHARWMIRSYALALSAVTLRAWKVLLVLLFHPHPMDAYRIVAWLGWTLNLALAEALIRWLAARRARRANLRRPDTRLVPQEVQP
jgi:hypothetical protein